MQRLRRGFIREYRSRLGFLRTREDQRRTGADGLTIDFMLREFAERVGARGEPHRGAASWIAAKFPAAERRALFTLLHDIEERIPWHPSIGRALKEN